jgi:cobalamin biosynthetic protein CobC
MTHGGEVDAACERFGIPRHRWLDLSTGMNPNPYPLPEIAREYWHCLPDATLDRWLREAAAHCYRVRDPDLVVSAPGSQALIQWLPRMFPPQRVAILGPTYAGHAPAWRAAGHCVQDVATLEDIADGGIIVVVNPNNPDGRIVDPQRILALSRSRVAVVDEAFADVVPEVSLAPHVHQGELVVLRSIGKFFGLAGMRLGFAIAHRGFADRLRGVLGPWAVSGPAAAIGAVALVDDTWIRSSRVRLIAAAGRLDGLLVRARLAIAGGTAMFRLVSADRAEELFGYLARAGILVRSFNDRPNWLRFGMPGNEESFGRLAAALAAWHPRVGAAMAPG